MWAFAQVFCRLLGFGWLNKLGICSYQCDNRHASDESDEGVKAKD
jgi:hypothetical protein